MINREPTPLSPEEFLRIKHVPKNRHSTAYLIDYHLRLAAKYAQMTLDGQTTKPKRSCRF